MKRQPKAKAGHARVSHKGFLAHRQTAAPKFRSRAKAIAAVAGTHKPSQITHEECLALLEFYVDSETRGENATAIYPGLAQHLKTCKHCEQAHATLIEAVSPNALDDFTLAAEKKIALPFLAPSTPSEAWNKQIYSQIAGGPLGFRFTFHPRHLERVISQTPLYVTRGDDAVATPLLLLDSIELGKIKVQVELRLEASEESEFARLAISIVPSAPLPEPLRATLHLNDEQYPVVLEQGHGRIDQIPTSALENVRASIEFEVGSPSDSTENVNAYTG